MSRELYHSLFDTVLPLGDAILLCPAHGAGSVCGSAIGDRPWTTIGIERKRNSLLNGPSEEAFVAAASRELERPPYFATMERLNREGPPVGDVPEVPPLTVQMLSAIGDQLQIVDARSTLAFATAHIPGALSIWEDGLPSYAGWLVRYDQPIALVADRNEPRQAARHLHRLGFDNIVGVLGGGMRSWHAAGRDSSSVTTLSAAELQRALEKGENPWILDVRTAAEVEADPIPSSAHIHVTQLPERLSEVPEDRRVTIFCGTGLRSMVAAAVLLRAGQSRPRVVLGGEKGWASADRQQGRS
jgi:hydroxyacylglutathione hydrolase